MYSENTHKIYISLTEREHMVDHYILIYSEIISSIKNYFSAEVLVYIIFDTLSLCTNFHACQMEYVNYLLTVISKHQCSS